MTRTYSSVPDSAFPKAPECPHHAPGQEPERETGPIEESIRAKVVEALEPTYFDIKNDSWMHSHHKPMQGASNRAESHFNMVIISPKFKELRGLPARHRYVYKLLSDEIDNRGVHAIQMKTKTPEEWERELARNQ